jgi:Putative Actinobacterial Holin-X, holin superfamily III
MDSGLSLGAALRSVYQESRILLHDHLRLALLEARRAVRNLAMMVALGVAAALLGVTAWLALVAALVAVAVDLGASWPVALFGTSVVTVAVAVGAALWIRYLGAQLMFVLTLGWLRPSGSHAEGQPAQPSEMTR